MLVCVVHYFAHATSWLANANSTWKYSILQDIMLIYFCRYFRSVSLSAVAFSGSGCFIDIAVIPDPINIESYTIDITEKNIQIVGKVCVKMNQI